MRVACLVQLSVIINLTFISRQIMNTASSVTQHIIFLEGKIADLESKISVLEAENQYLKKTRKLHISLKTKREGHHLKTLSNKELWMTNRGQGASYLKFQRACLAMALWNTQQSSAKTQVAPSAPSIARVARMHSQNLSGEWLRCEDSIPYTDRVLATINNKHSVDFNKFKGDICDEIFYTIILGDVDISMDDIEPGFEQLTLF